MIAVQQISIQLAEFPTDLKMFIAWASTNFDLPILQEFLDAVPTAELEPIICAQSDEADYGNDL
jgi:NAD+ synthase (glutamine-hydrolysing)